MKTTDNWRGNQFRRAGRKLGLVVRNRSVAIQALMRPGHVVILVNVLPEQPLQVRLAQHNHVVEQPATQRADKSFNERILPGAPIGDTDFLDAESIEETPHAVAVDAVVVAEQIARLQSPRGRLAQLLEDPTHVRMPGVIEVRLVKVTVDVPGFRVKSLVLVTTLTDAD